MKMKTLLVLGLLALLPTKLIAGPMAYTVELGSQELQTIDLTTGTVTTIGNTGVNLMRGLTFVGSTLYGVSQETDQLYTIDTSTGAATMVGALGVNGIGGLAANSVGDIYYGYEFDEELYSVDETTGAATLIGSMGVSITALAFDAMGMLFGYADTPDNALYTIDVTTGLASLIGGVGFTSADGGIAFDATGTLYYALDDGTIGTLDTASGAGTQLFSTGNSYSSLAIMSVPEPQIVLLLLLGGAGIALTRRRQK